MVWVTAMRTYEVMVGTTRVGVIFGGGSIGDDVTIDGDRMSETMGDVSRATMGGTI